MNYIDSLNTSDTSDQSSIFSNNCFEDISSIQNTSVQDSFINFWNSSPVQNNRYDSDLAKNSELQSLYRENQLLKRKIQSLEDSLKNPSKSQNFFEDPTPPKSSSWIRSNTQHLDDYKNDSCIKSLSQEMQTAWETGSTKRGRDFESDKGPKKFLKLAIMQSIGTLKF